MRYASNEKLKGYLTDGMELPKQEKIRALGEKETYNYSGILKADTIKHVEMNEKKFPLENQKAT